MDPTPPSPTQDPEFQNAGNDILRGDLGDSPEEYLRLIANPFLSFFFITLWLGVLYKTLIEGLAGPLTPILLLIMVFSLLLIPWLAHYHCLDCGRTGALPRWRKHTCERAVARRDSGQLRRLRGPSPPVQIIVWVCLILLVSMLAWQVFPG